MRKSQWLLKATNFILWTELCRLFEYVMISNGGLTVEWRGIYLNY